MSMGRRYKFKTEKEGSAPIIVLAFLILVILIGVGVGFIFFNKEEGEKGGAEEKPAPKPKEEVVVEECDENCKYESALKEENVALCKAINNQTLRENCFRELSDSVLEACLLVEDREVRDFCARNFAVKLKNITLCDQVSDREGCRIAVDPCLSAEDYEFCTILQSGDPTQCGDDNCLMEFALALNDSGACLLMESEISKRACQSLISGRDWCKELEASEKDYCYKKYAEMSDKPQFCYEIRRETLPYRECISYFAVKYRDKNLCKESGLVLNDLWICYINYSIGTGDISGCEEIHRLATTHRFKCAFGFAKRYGDPSACEVIERTASKITCYAGVLIHEPEILDPSTCDGITSSTVWRYKCYTVSAINSKDPSYCNKIPEEAERNSCINNYQKAIEESVGG